MRYIDVSTTESFKPPLVTKTDCSVKPIKSAETKKKCFVKLRTPYSKEGGDSGEQAACNLFQHKTTRVQMSILCAVVGTGKFVGVCVMHTRAQRSQTSQMSRGMIGILVVN